MTLLIQSSNRVEILQLNLGLQLTQTPLSNPFTAEVVVVPTYAMARWLNLQFAKQHGIAANIQFQLPAQWLWQLASGLIDPVPEQDPYQRESMGWKVYSLLPELIPQAGFETLRHYLDDDDSGQKRWQLSQRIANVFDRYQYYRPQMIRDWSRGDNADWQALLWRALVAKLGQNHRVEVLDRVIRRLDRNVDLNQIPERVALFGISSLPPLFVEIIHALAAHIDISLFQHSPTDQYWADLKNSKQMSRLRLADPEQAEYYDTGNELLTAWGRQGQVMQDLLLDSLGSSACEFESYLAPGSKTLLQSVQQSIFDADESPVVANSDDSISIHVCHSPLRECQVLHNQLLAMLARDKSLNAEDILVMIPDVSRYAPYIEAVFRRDENQTRPTLRWNLSDITVADKHPLVLTFLQLIELPSSRFNYSEIISLLDIAEVRDRFDIDEQALDDIHQVLEDSRVRWGIDADHKSTLELPAINQNTWQQAKQRIFAGYAFAHDNSWQGIAPLENIEANRAESLGKFWAFFDKLTYWHNALNITTTASDWQQRLNHLLDDFFLEQDQSEGHLQSIRDCIDGLKQAEDTAISAALMTQWLTQQLSTQEIFGQLFSGGITFCGMRPMRNIPFRVICLLGMNDLAFPRRETPLEFDLMAKQWRQGDPLKGDEDRYLMLETLLNARDSLYISYSGRSMKDNSVCQASVLVDELVDFITTQVSVESGSLAASEITHYHPMQAFSPKNYTEGNANYDAYWHSIASKMMQTTKAPSIDLVWPKQPLDLSDATPLTIDLNQLKRFLQHPVRYFCNQALKLYLDSDKSTEDEESFDLDGLEQWSIKQRLIHDYLMSHQSTVQTLQAEGRLPHGNAGELSFEQIQLNVESFLPFFQGYQNKPRQVLGFDHDFALGYRLTGQINQYYPGQGVLHFSTASLKGKYLIPAWLDHLALCAKAVMADNESNRLICRDHFVRFEPISRDDALAQLERYCQIFAQGQRQPLPIFPDASFIWAQTRKIKLALTKWSGNTFVGIPGDKDDGYIALILRGIEQSPVETDAFEHYADAVYGFALESMVEL